MQTSKDQYPPSEKEIEIGTWNAHSVYEGELKMVESEIIHYNIAILCISE